MSSRFELSTAPSEQSLGFPASSPLVDRTLGWPGVVMPTMPVDDATVSRETSPGALAAAPWGKDPRAWTSTYASVDVVNPDGRLDAGSHAPPVVSHQDPVGSSPNQARGSIPQGRQRSVAPETSGSADRMSLGSLNDPATVCVSRETEREGLAIAVSDAVGPGVSRETAADLGTAERIALAESLPQGDADSPLARAVARDARKRIVLTGRVLPRPPRTRILTVANQKGGVGKTTTAVNVAAALAQGGARVLVIDLDPQGNASTALGVAHHAEVPSVYDVLVDDRPLVDVVQANPDIDGLLCAPATIDLAGAEIELVSLVARETRLSKAIAAYLANREEATEQIDYIFIDCPPSLGLLTINAFVAAREVFIPIQCEYYALEGLSQLLKNIELVRAHLNPGLHVSSILLTMFDARTRLSAQVADEVRSHFPKQTFNAAIPRSVRVSEAPSHAQSVMTYDPNSSGALSYLEAASEMAERGRKEQHL